VIPDQYEFLFAQDAFSDSDMGWAFYLAKRRNRNQIFIAKPAEKQF
jgi:hypothetical protein